MFNKSAEITLRKFRPCTVIAYLHHLYFNLLLKHMIRAHMTLLLLTDAQHYYSNFFIFMFDENKIIFVTANAPYSRFYIQKNNIDDGNTKTLHFPRYSYMYRG